MLFVGTQVKAQMVTHTEDVIQSIQASQRVMRLRLLDDDGTHLSTASGFVTNGLTSKQDGKIVQERAFLWTCWHVVTGFDPRDPKILVPPNRRWIEVSGQGQSPSQAGVNLYGMGGAENYRLPLYNEQNLPLWQQQRGGDSPHPDLNSIGIYVPHADVVRIPFSLKPEHADLWCFRDDDVGDTAWLGQDVFIAGYPYGYSARADYSLEPVFLKRGIASAMPGSMSRRILDGVGSKCMSGGPMLKKNARGFSLVGIYLGSEYPDFKSEVASGTINDPFAALGLMADFNSVRMGMS